MQKTTMDPFPAKPLDLRKFSPVKDTLKQYDEAVAKCRDVFVKKNADYGASWRILRPSSLTDQLMIKASFRHIGKNLKFVIFITEK